MSPVNQVGTAFPAGRFELRTKVRLGVGVAMSGLPGRQPKRKAHKGVRKLVGRGIDAAYNSRSRSQFGGFSKVGLRHITAPDIGWSRMGPQFSQPSISSPPYSGFRPGPWTEHACCLMRV